MGSEMCIRDRYHRASHRVRFLWAVHMNHHSSEEMNFLVAFRQAWFGPITKVPFFAVLPIFFLDPTITIVAGAVATLFGVLISERFSKSIILILNRIYEL